VKDEGVPDWGKHAVTMLHDVGSGTLPCFAAWWEHPYCNKDGVAYLETAMLSWWARNTIVAVFFTGCVFTVTQTKKQFLIYDYTVHTDMNRILCYRFTSYFGIHDCCVTLDTGTNTITEIWAALAVDLGVKVSVVACSCRKLRWSKLLRLVAAYTFYGAADHDIRQLAAYEFYSLLWRWLSGQSIS